ncbi:PREDICTED: arylsulfatase B-like isoform X2 [Priapulus caudatus]|uniref:Arylsulfatase B-like isoform X2 n=1 Tax=Priapulus caudatus TaxID=37621 RepID=A0ABM1ERP7_PRICU|nr:PREDICTED: arylsulfatase B-like isoform X2 [Priapulus caudatus]
MVMRGMIALLLALTATVEAQKQPPHIIFILADDLGWNDVSFHGSGQIPTPNIDALAYDGIILNNYYVSPICTPTRSAILTGRHPIHTGQQVDTILGSRPYGVPLNETLMPQYLKKCGYATHIVGKWHLGFFAREYTPLFRGFDSHYGYWLGHQDYYDHTAQGGNGYWGYDMRRNMSVDRSASNKYTTDLFTEEAVTVINSHDKSKPLFLYLAHLATHSANSYSPLQAPQKYLQKVQHIKHKQRRLFGGMAVGLDESVGQVVQALKANNMLDSSIIVFSTDNGGPASGFDMNYANNAPLRGVKDTLWEGGVRGVGFIWSRLLRKTRRVSQQMMHITDWLPTLYHAAGGDTGELVAPDGISMWPALSGGGASPRNEILHNIDDVRHIAALRRGDWKIRIGHTYAGHWDGWYELPEATVRAPDSAFVTPLTRILGDPPRPHDWESVVISCGKKPDNASVNCRPTVAPCLFNIRDDPCEYNNMAAARPDVVSALLGRLAMYNATQVKPANKPIDPKSNPKFYDYVWTWWKTLDASGREHYVLNDL